MDEKLSKLTEEAWTARFWAYYKLLPESLKEGFIKVAEGLAQDAERKRKSSVQTANRETKGE